MYQAIVRRIVRAGFCALSAGDYEHMVRQFHPQVIYSFAGSPPLGGERTGVEDVRAWFQRIYSSFPGIQCTTHDVIVQGWPWNTLVATRLSIAAPRADGSVYRHEAMQFARLRWEKSSRIPTSLPTNSKKSLCQEEKNGHEYEWLVLLAGRK